MDGYRIGDKLYYKNYDLDPSDYTLVPCTITEVHEDHAIAASELFEHLWIDKDSEDLFTERS